MSRKINDYLKDYDNFFTPERSSVFYNVILESIVVYKDKFKELLKEMDTPMSNEILSLQKKDVPTRNNDFNLTTSNDSISFIPDRKYQDIIKTKNVWVMTDKLKFTTTKFEKYPDAKAIWDGVGLEVPKELNLENGIKGTIGDKRASSKRTKKTYVAFYPLDKKYTPVPANVKYLQEDKNFVQTELSKSVQEIKAGRGMKALLMAAGMIKTDKEVEEFVNKFKSTYDIINNAFRYLDIVEGEDIRKYYNYNCYESPTAGQLGNSCMRSPNCSTFFDIYCLNPEKVKLVILRVPKSKDKIKGRAVLWKLDDGRTLLDRVYTNNDSDINLFYEFAKKNGWLIKNNISEHLKTTLNPINYKQFPYMDTMRYYYNNAHVISNVSSLKGYEKAACYQLTSTGGTYEIIRSCPTCGGTKIKRCLECRGQGSVRCVDCKGAGSIPCKKCGGVKYKSGEIFIFPNVPTSELPRICDVKDQIKVGSVVRTNASDDTKEGKVIEGIICCVAPDPAYKNEYYYNRFWISQNDNEGGSPPIKCDKFGFRYTWTVSLNNTTWINFGTMEKNPDPPCDECKGSGQLRCKTCKGYGKTTCKTCDGKKGDPCPECSPTAKV